MSVNNFTHRNALLTQLFLIFHSISASISAGFKSPKAARQDKAGRSGVQSFGPARSRDLVGQTRLGFSLRVTSLPGGYEAGWGHGNMGHGWNLCILFQKRGDYQSMIQRLSVLVFLFPNNDWVVMLWK
jgi:hypothetical protein